MSSETHSIQNISEYYKKKPSREENKNTHHWAHGTNTALGHSWNLAGVEPGNQEGPGC